MDPDFAAKLESWHDFYAATAGVSATLVGLLFVSLALNPSILAADRPPALRTWAGQTFHSFLIVLIISLVTLIPQTSPFGLEITLAILGVQGLVRVARDLRILGRDPDPRWRGRTRLFWAMSPIIAYVVCLWVAFDAWRGDGDAFDWLVTAIFFLMVSAAGSCLDLLREIGAPSDRPPPGAG